MMAAVEAAPTQFFEVEDGVKLAYRVLGRQDGRAVPLVLVQGLTGVKEDWVLAQTRKVVVFDNRGIGESAVPDGPYPVSLMATDALRLIDHLSLADVHVGGISMGGMITQWMVLQLAEFNAARARPPIRIHRIILGCTTPGGAAFREAPPHADFMGAFKGGSADGPLSAAAKRDIVEKTMIVNLTHDYVRRHPDRLASLVDENLRYRRSLRGIMNQMMGVATHDSAARLHEIGELVEATLIIHGDSDLVVPLSNGMALKRGIRNSRMVVLPDVGHVFWQMDDGKSAQLVHSFLADPVAKL